MQLRPAHANEADLGGEQRHPGAEGKGVNLKDQRRWVVRMAGKAFRRGRSEPHQHAQPAEGQEDEKEVAVPFVIGDEAPPRWHPYRGRDGQLA